MTELTHFSVIKKNSFCHRKNKPRFASESDILRQRLPIGTLNLLTAAAQLNRQFTDICSAESFRSARIGITRATAHPFVVETMQGLLEFVYLSLVCSGRDFDVVKGQCPKRRVESWRYIKPNLQNKIRITFVVNQCLKMHVTE